jgi:competence protein ComEA
VENFLTSSRNRLLLILSLIGLILIGCGVFFFKSGLSFGGTKVEVLSESTGSENQKVITAEIAGQVMIPGVFKLNDGSRVDDLLISAGGFSAKADRTWIDKYLNRAARLTDGQKIYVPTVGEQSNAATAKNNAGDQTISTSFSSDSSGLININSASLSQLDSLPGIGQVYGQSIIEHRPYSTVEELLSKGALKNSVFQKIKDKVSVY